MKRFLWPAVFAAVLFLAFRLDRFRRNVDRVAIVTIDTVRADHLPFHGYPRPTAEFLPELSAQGYFFDDATTSSPDLPLALRGLATSRYAFEAAAPNAATLLDQLSSRGFETAAFSDDPEFVAAVGVTPFEASSDLFEAARSAALWFRSRDRPRKVAVWLHLSGAQEAAHSSRVDDLAPIGPELGRFLVSSEGLPSGADGLPTEAALKKVRLHDARIRAVDRALNMFYGMSVDRKKPTVMIITGCRREAFDVDDDGERLDEGMVHVPLIVWFSDDNRPGRRLSGLVRHIDIWPTVAELVLPFYRRLGIHTEGRSFASALRNKGSWAGTASAYLERASGSSALVAGARKLVKTGGLWRLYDLRSDPLERHDLSALDGGTFARMRRRLERLARG